MMLYSLLKESAERHPDSTLVRFKNSSYTYKELCRLTDLLANSLTKLGLKSGDRLGMFLYNRPEILICYFACFKIGATAVPVNYRLKSDEIRYILNHAAPSILISESVLFYEVANVKQDLSSLEQCFLVDWKAGVHSGTRSFSELLAQPEYNTAMLNEYRDTDAVILYTSGTTGNPKGAILTHEKLVTHTVSHCQLVDYKSGDNTLVCLALSNNFAFSHQMLAAVNAGAMLEILPSFDAHEALESIEQGSVTMLYMMPVMYHALVKLAETKSGLLPNQLRLAVVAGDTTPQIVFDQFAKYFSIEMCEGIGMTETQIYALNPLVDGKKPGSVGMPVPYQQVSVQDNDGTALPAGELGEIVVKSNIVIDCYLDNPRATAESFRNGWFLTGDLGCFDDDGYLWFRGRRKQLIVHDGSNISPQEVEEIFYHHHAVSEVGVIGVPDPVDGENVQAFIVLKPGSEDVTGEMLLDFASHHLADYKLPESILFIDTLPKGVTGKIDRKKLHEYVPGR
jgi:long-chain acyl-CoA synthetase